MLFFFYSYCSRYYLRRNSFINSYIQNIHWNEINYEAFGYDKAVIDVDIITDLTEKPPSEYYRHLDQSKLIPIIPMTPENEKKVISISFFAS